MSRLHNVIAIVSPVGQNPDLSQRHCAHMGTERCYVYVGICNEIACLVAGKEQKCCLLDTDVTTPCKASCGGAMNAKRCRDGEFEQ